MGWYPIYPNARGSMGQKRVRCGSCDKPDSFGDACLECSAERGCIKCGAGHFKLGRKCMKNPLDFDHWGWDAFKFW